MDSFIRKLSDHIGKNWKKVARELKFSPTDVDAIEYKARDDLKEQIHLFFEAWKMREGSRATVKMLDDALKKANLQGILDVMTGIYHILFVMANYSTHLHVYVCTSVL